MYRQVFVMVTVHHENRELIKERKPEPLFIEKLYMIAV